MNKEPNGTEAHSKASKARWQDIPKEERKERMSALAKARWAKMSVEEKAAYSQKMIEAKRKKNGII